MLGMTNSFSNSSGSGTSTPNIYGVKYNGKDSKGIRTYSAKNMRFQPSTNNFCGIDDFADVPPFNVKECLTYYSEGKRKVYAYKDTSKYYADARASGQYDVMIEFPLFYYKRPSKWEWQISAEPLDGFLPSPMHNRNNKIHDVARVSKYCVNSNYMSLPNQVQLVNTEISTFCTNLRARGLYVLDYNSVCAIQMLGAVKYGCLDSQKTVGRGWLATTNTAKKNTGACDNVLGLDGSPTGLNTNEQVVAFGIEDLWGNIWKYIDGIIRYSGTNGGQIYLCPDITTLVSYPDASSIENWIKPETYILTSDNTFGHIVDIAYDNTYTWLNYPIAYGESWPTGSVTQYALPVYGPIGDGYWIDTDSTNMYLGLFGGHWHHGFSVGLFSLHFAVVLSGVGTGIGSAALELP